MFNTGLLNVRDILMIGVISVGFLVLMKWAAATAGLNLPEI